MSLTYSEAARGFILSRLSMSGMGDGGAGCLRTVTAASLRVCSRELMLMPCCLAAMVWERVRGTRPLAGLALPGATSLSTPLAAALVVGCLAFRDWSCGCAGRMG
jgi:hypothetical protein